MYNSTFPNDLFSKASGIQLVAAASQSLYQVRYAECAVICQLQTMSENQGVMCSSNISDRIWLEDVTPIFPLKMEQKMMFKVLEQYLRHLRLRLCS